MSKSKSKKVCQRCCKEISQDIKTCVCGSEKFAPPYVKKIEKINRQFSVQVTEPNKDLYKDNKNVPDKRITLYKWWPGNKSSLHINSVEDWEKIKDIIDQRLSKYLGWRTKKEIVEDIEKFEKLNKKTDKKIKNLAKNYPDFIRKTLKNIDYNKISENNSGDLVEIITDLTDAISKTDEGFNIVFKKLVKQLPKQPKRALEDLSELLKDWSLKQITDVSSQVMSRLKTLELFKERILDDKTFEIIGKNSIHRILERAMWIIDERYWLLHSNETLRTIVGDELIKKDKKNKKKRPDFVCGTVGNKLVIVELKRPSHALKIEDLNQLENYLSIIEDNHTSHSGIEAYLIGKKIDKDLQRKKKYRSSQFKIKTFSDLIDDTEKRYKEFIEILN